MKEDKKYWYQQTYIGCPICGKGRTIKERVYDDKPKDLKEVYEEIEQYDWCQD